MRSATVYRVLPEAAADVINVLLGKGKEFKYEEDLALFVRAVEDRKNYKVIEVLLDYTVPILRKIRKDGKVDTIQERIKTVAEIKLALFHEIRGSGAIDNVVVVLSRKSIAKLLANAISKIVDKAALLRLRFDFSYTRQQAIVNLFDDIVKITSEDVDDARIDGLSLKGHSLYGAYEFQKAFTGRVKRIGVRLGDTWFLVSSEGVITTYQWLRDDEFIEKIKVVLERLLAAGVVVL